MYRDLVDFCEDAFIWIEACQKNVIVVHCKRGKGEPCVSVCCVLCVHGGRGSCVCVRTSRGALRLARCADF